MKKLLAVLFAAVCATGCAVGAEDETAIIDEAPVEGVEQREEGALDAASGDEIVDTRASVEDGFEAPAHHLTGDEQEGPDPTPWLDEETGEDEDERSGPDPTPWHDDEKDDDDDGSGPDPTPWRSQATGTSGGTGNLGDSDGDEPDPQPWLNAESDSLD